MWNGEHEQWKLFIVTKDGQTGKNSVYKKWIVIKIVFEALKGTCPVYKLAFELLGLQLCLL